MPHIDRRPTHRRGILRVHYQPFRRDNIKRPHCPLVVIVRQRRIEKKDRPGNRDAVGAGVAGVDEAPALLVTLGKIDRQLISFDRGFATHRHRHVQLVAIIVGRGLPVVGPILHFLDAGTHGALGALLHDCNAVHHRFDTVPADQFGQPVVGHLSGRNHRIAVNFHPFGQPHIVPDQPQDIALFLALLNHFYPGDQNALGVDIVGIGKVGAGEGRAGVLHVGAGQSPEGHLSLVEDGAEKAPVGGVAGVAVVGIVG